MSTYVHPIAANTRLDIPTSVRLAEAIHALPKNCWWNALGALGRFPKLLGDASYVEGKLAYADMPWVTFEHGWLERPDGTVLDATVVAWRSGVVQGERSPHYYAVVRYSREEAVGGRFSRRTSFPITSWMACTGWRRAEFQALLDALGPEVSAEARARLRAMYRIDELDAAEQEREKGA